MLNDLKDTIRNPKVKSQYIKEKAANKLIKYLFGKDYIPQPYEVIKLITFLNEQPNLQIYQL
jgi:hypothetical protein